MLSELAKKNRSSLWDSLSRLSLAKEQGQDYLFADKKGSNEIESFMSLIEKLRENMVGKKGLSGKVLEMVETINYWGHLVTEFSKDEKKARWKYANINYLIEMIKNWENDPDNLDTGLFAYLNRISLLTRTDNNEDSTNKVNLMTIHASKGLEFPVVFIAGAEKGIIPHDRSLEDAGLDTNPMEEERRLFYVAITRARDKLFITSCHKRKRLQNISEQQPSPFLAEIPAQLIENHGDATEEKTDSQDSAEMFFSKMRERYGTT
jgi:DNA helicase-2/ATP-dependent DNA helicase PcrA